MVNGLNVARRSIGNQILVDAVSNSIDRVKEGKALGPSLAECPALFAGSVLEMISVAEESGRLDQELVRIANVTEGDLDRRLKTAVAMAEPLMLFFIAFPSSRRKAKPRAEAGQALALKLAGRLTAECAHLGRS